MIRNRTYQRRLLIAATVALCVGVVAPGAAHAQRRLAITNGQPQGPAKIPGVLLSMRELGLCKVRVGDKLPAIELPKADGGGNANLGDLFGKRATVVVFWKGDRRMAREQLADLGPDVIEPFGKEGVSVVGVAVQESPETTNQALSAAKAKFTNLVDADGNAFKQVGRDNLPRTFVLDSEGKVVWFDIAYSLATRRELNSTLRALTEPK